MKDKRVSLYVAAAALVLAGVIPALPDTQVGSPRAIATGLVSGLLAASLLLRGKDARPLADE